MGIVEYYQQYYTVLGSASNSGWRKAG